MIDLTAPAGGSVGYVDGYSAASVAVTTDDGTDAGSGLDPTSGVVERDEAPLSGDTCDAFPGAWSEASSPDTTVQSATCYRYRYRVADLAGNVATYTSSSVVKIDSSAPGAPGIALSESSPFELVSGTTLFYNPAAGNGASFDVTATTSDAQSGITSVEFPVVFGGDATTDTTAPYSATYTWDDSATAVGSSTVTAENGAGLTSTGSFSVTPDTTAPTGGSLDYADGFTTVPSVSLVLAEGTDDGAGLAPTGTELQRASATLSNGTCGSLGGFATIATDPPLSMTDLTVTSGHCYAYRYVVSDEVGNQAVYTSANVDAVDSDAPTVEQDDPGQYLGGTVDVSATAADTGGSDLASVAFQRSPTGDDSWTTIATDTLSPWQTSLDTTLLADGGYDFRAVATDKAGNVTTSAVVSNRRVDNESPSVTLADPGGNVHSTVTLSATSSDAGSGIASTTYQTSPAGGGTWTDTPAAWDTTALADGVYDVRAVATDRSGTSSSSVVAGSWIRGPTSAAPSRWPRPARTAGRASTRSPSSTRRPAPAAGPRRTRAGTPRWCPEARTTCASRPPTGPAT
jgi:hypothetical protein